MDCEKNGVLTATDIKIIQSAANAFPEIGIEVPTMAGGKRKRKMIKRKNLIGGASPAANVLAMIIVALATGISSYGLRVLLLQPEIARVFAIIQPCSNSFEQGISWIANRMGGQDCLLRQTLFEQQVGKIIENFKMLCPIVLSWATTSNIADWIDDNILNKCNIDGPGPSAMESVIADGSVTTGGRRRRRNIRTKKGKSYRRKRTYKRRKLQNK